MKENVPPQHVEVLGQDTLLQSSQSVTSLFGPKRLISNCSQR